jgi:anti-anti-sigma factor
MGLQVESASWEGGMSLRLIGELDLASRLEAESILLQPLESQSSLVVDLSALTFMDSSGLATLVHAKKTAEQSGRPFALVAGPPQVQRVLEVTGLLEEFVFVDTWMPDEGHTD